ncbi:MAG: PrsW family intramembrane metalloprotease [Acidobacteria bacterium]|nr:PrsW family intramembrane metalloprotease [Acidobacteriota bacterium]
MLIILLSLLPCLFWLAFFYVQDWHDREPISLVFVTFLLGIFATIPALIFNTVGIVFVAFFLGQNSFLSNFVQFFGIVGPVEESAKLLAVLVFAYKQPEFDEPIDGVIYAAAAALGFAAAENVLYVSQFQNLEILKIRGPISNAGHALFSAFWGLALSQAKAASNVRGKRTNIIIYGLLLAAITHGLFDFILVMIGDKSLILSFITILLLMGGMFWYVESNVLEFIKKSPKRNESAKLKAVLRCPNCGQVGRAGLICRKCRKKLPQIDLGEMRSCAKCSAINEPGSVSCNYCHQSLLAIVQSAPTSVYPHFIKITELGTEEILHVLDKPSIAIGKTLDNEFVLDDETVENRHALVFWDERGYHIVQDLNSINGVFINGKRVNEGYLQNGYEVRFGQVRLIYRALNIMQI